MIIVPSRPFPAVRLNSSEFEERQRLPVEGMVFYPLGRLALLRGLISLGLKAGDAIIVPAYYCESALQRVVAHGFKPIFVDVDEALQMPVDAVEALLTHKIKAVLLPHFFGITPTARDEMIVLCQSAGVKVIEDCSHSFLSRLYARNTRHEADAYIFSMRKTLPVSDGGALLLGKHCPNTVIQPPANRSFIVELPCLTLRMIEALIVKLGWPNLYCLNIDRLRAALSRSGDGIEKAATHDDRDNEHTPSYSLMRYLRNGSYLRHIAETRILNYRKLAHALACLNIKPIVNVLSDADIPQVLPVRDAHGTLVRYLRERGIGAYRWPGEEMPSEVKLNPDLYPNAIRLNESIACLPVHQDINGKHIALMADAVAEWVKTLPAGSSWR